VKISDQSIAAKVSFGYKELNAIVPKKDKKE